MPLVHQGGLTGKKAGLQGIEKVADRFMAGYVGRKQQAQDDAMKIWQMAQSDPLILERPETKRTFNLAGWAVPSVKRKSIDELMASVPKGSQASYNIDPTTGQPTNFRVSPRDAIMDAFRRMQIDQYRDTIDPGWRDREKAEAGAIPPPPGVSTVNPAATPRLPGLDMGALASQWLQPDQFTGFVPPAPRAVPVARGPIPFIPPFGGPQLDRRNSGKQPAAAPAGRIPPTGPTTASKATPSGVGIGKPSIRPQPTAPRPEFNAIWPKLSAEQRYKVALAMGKKATVQQILEALALEGIR